MEIETVIRRMMSKTRQSRAFGRWGDGGSEVTEEMPARPRAGAPVFILAPQARTGTNYLWELLRRHPDVAPARSPVWEDYLLVHARKLAGFARLAQRSWDPTWGPTDHLEAELLRHLGDGLVSFLEGDSGRRVVTKSPTIANLDLFFDIFPDACLLLLVRDGRDVAASGMKTFGWTLEDAARSWAWGVDRVLEFVADHADDRVRPVWFEDLVERTQPELVDLLDWLDLDAASYDFSDLSRIPVRGSSSYLGDGERNVNWRPLPPRSDFRPLERFRHWSRRDVDVFEDIAGPQLERLGYRLDGAARATRSRQAVPDAASGPTG